MKIRCIDIQVKSALNVFRDDGYSLNPYRGCSHSCAYCYAAGSFWRESMKTYFPTVSSHYTTILVKRDLARTLRGELMAKRPHTIYIGTITDPYQPCEGIKRITRDVLESLLYLPPKHIHILTKGTLIVRDIDILQELSHVADVKVSFTITTLNPFHFKHIERNAPNPWLRLKAMKMLSGAGIQVGVSIAPIMPGINDNFKVVKRIWEVAEYHGASYFFIDALKLDRDTRRHLFATIKDYMPGMLKTYKNLFRKEQKPLSLTIYTEHLRKRLEEEIKSTCHRGRHR